jgi:predicted nucleotidyltransferase
MKNIRNKSEIISLLRQNREKLKDFGVSRIGLFGSFARNEQHKDSDIDLLIDFEAQKKTYDNYTNLYFFLQELLQAKIDLLTPQSISPRLSPFIEKDVEYVAIAA